MTPANPHAKRASTTPGVKRKSKSPACRVDSTQSPCLGVIKPGTLCFLSARSTSPLAHLIGRVVEVVLGPRAEFGPGPGPYYEVRAGWIDREFPMYDVIVVERQFLVPITPDELGEELPDETDNRCPAFVEAP